MRDFTTDAFCVGLVSGIVIGFCLGGFFITLLFICFK